MEEFVHFLISGTNNNQILRIHLTGGWLLGHVVLHYV